MTNYKLSVTRAVDVDMEKVWSNCTELAQRMDYPSFFCSGDWLKASAESLASGNTLFMLVAKSEERVKAILPLVAKRNLLGGKDLHFLGADYYPDPLGLICEPAERAKYCVALKDYLLTVRGWDRLILDWILEDEVKDWRLPGEQISVEPFKLLRQSFAELLAEFKQKKRYNLRAMTQKFIDAGGELVTSRNTGNHKVFLDALFSLHQKRAVEKAIQSSFDGPRIWTLHRRLIELSANVRFYGLRFNGQLIAVLYGFDFCNKFFYYQVAHDPEHGDLSPGSVLLFLVIEDCCKRGLKEFNFLQGDESYKGIWSKESRVLYRCVLKRGTLRSRMLDGLERAKKGLKTIPARIGHGS